MSCETTLPTPPRARSRRRSPSDRLREAILVLAEQRGQIVAHKEKAWASISFAGMRHSFGLLFAGEEAVAAGERFIVALPEHEFALPGQLVADASVVEVDHRIVPNPRLAVRCEILLLEDC